MTEKLLWPGEDRPERKNRRWMLTARLDVSGARLATIDMTHDLVRSIRRWESSQVKVMSERYRLLYCTIFQLNENNLFALYTKPTAACDQKSITLLFGLTDVPVDDVFAGNHGAEPDHDDSTDVVCPVHEAPVTVGA